MSTGSSSGVEYGRLDSQCSPERAAVPDGDAGELRQPRLNPSRLQAKEAVVRQAAAALTIVLHS